MKRWWSFSSFISFHLTPKKITFTKFQFNFENINKRYITYGHLFFLNNIQPVSLPKSSLQMHWILVRFYEMGDIWGICYGSSLYCTMSNNKEKMLKKSKKRPKIIQSFHLSTVHVFIVQSREINNVHKWLAIHMGQIVKDDWWYTYTYIIQLKDKPLYTWNSWKQTRWKIYLLLRNKSWKIGDEQRYSC